MATDVIVLDAVESMAEDIDTTLDEKLDPFIDEATAIVEKLGTGLPPRDMIAFTSQSTDDGIKLTFTPPDVTYFVEHTSGDGKQFACMPAGVLIRYSDVGYPRTPNDGVFGYDYKPTGDWDTESHSCTIVGLTKDTKYYFTAFPYSTEHVYNKNQIAGNRTEMTWVGNKGTISVTVNTPEGYQRTLGEYTITLVDQAADSPQNIEQTASGQGLTRFGNLEGGKTYKVRLSTTSDLQAPADSEPITIVGGMNYDVTMTYVSRYGTLTVNVSTQPAGMPIGAYTVTLTPQGGGEAKSVQGNNSQAVVFSDVENGTVYTVSLSDIDKYTANAGGTVVAVGGINVLHSASYTFSLPLSDSSWPDIKTIAQTGNANAVFSAGDTKDITISGETLTMEIVGFNQDTANSITFGAKNLMATTRQMNGSMTNKGAFVGSEMYTYLSNDVYNALPQDLKSAIISVTKKVFAGDGAYVNGDQGVYSASMKIFLFAESEVFGTDSGFTPNEGPQYSRFATDSSRMKKLSNGSESTNDWWLRSPLSGNKDGFSYVNTQGKKDGKGANAYKGVCFGFCV